ncbi:FtsX-like permease family protein [Prevotella copri]|uniref:FtsX-like permease family protein n=1 Tax=Segatella copri TaxID=165179 RepID=A0AAW5ITG4_9BACT|nr:ABC transporter permease [Segatella copri]MCP9551183.1 FtsX-like permease family protein [Segatella copri]MCP9573052.1 FtsX-like permease family protein [Segatella copri]MCP9575422.1 FtsX-like permease family protein [Segatella copri]MCP9578368.1 FtsX-like permease family protein [Segatella copri]MCP9580801.1 FtsX-like permease family protein [Segatella copri]
MNMLLHNLKVALRNIFKYKVQTLGSILSLAIGMVTLATVHSFLQNFRMASINHEPYYDRVYNLRFDSIQKRQSDNSIRINGDIVRAVKANGGPRCIEQGPYAPNGMLTGGWAEFTLNGKTRRKMQLDAVPLDRNYPNFVGIRSAITGEKIKVLGPHDAIINEKQAKQIFGDKNPVGASIHLSKGCGNYQLRLVDVYQDLSLTELDMSISALFYSPCELEDMDLNQFYAVNLYVVLKEGCTPQQLKAEVNSRLKPLGLKVKTEKLKDRLSEEYSTVAIACSITYLIGSLILLAAIIGFLRMQTQLFWMRRREISLRITNGATRLQLFSMFATEVLVIVLVAYFVAVLMGSWICDYLARPQFTEITSELGTISHLYLYSLVIGLVVMMLCLAIIWIVLSRICKRTQALESGMRRSHNHWFRNTMLGVQVMISMFFLGVTFCLLCWVGKIAEFNHIPDDERAYEQSLFLQTNAAENRQRLRDKLIHLPQVERWMPYSWGFWKVNELAENEEFSKAAWQGDPYASYNNVTNYKIRTSADTSYLDFFKIKVNWKPKANRKKCILVNEELYKYMRQYHVAPNDILTLDDMDSYQIAGTFQSIPYQESFKTDIYSFIVIDPKEAYDARHYILVAKPGEYKEMQIAVDRMIQNLEPAVVKPMSSNLRDYMARSMFALEILQNIAWILAIVSLAICLISIFSTVMLDTQTRKKEVAIRKVNGALTKDITKLFGRTYLVITLIAMVFAVVAILLFHIVLSQMFNMVEINPVFPISLSVVIVIGFIAVIIACQVRKIMKVDPSEILAKE